MRQATAIILIICLFSSSALAGTHKASSKSEFSKLEKTQFGKNILNAIALHASSGEPVQNILDLLEEIETQLHEDQDAADVLHTDFQNQCDTNLESIQAELAVATTAIQEAQEDLDIAIPRYQTLSDDRDRLEEEIEDLNDDLIELYNTRQEESDSYADAIEEIEEALAVFTNARQVFERLAEDIPEAVVESVQDDDEEAEADAEDDEDEDDYDAADEVGSGDEDEDEEVDEDEEEELEAYYAGEDTIEDEDEDEDNGDDEDEEEGDAFEDFVNDIEDAEDEAETEDYDVDLFEDEDEEDEDEDEEDEDEDDEDEEDEDEEDDVEFVQVRSKKLGVAKAANSLAQVSATLKKVTLKRRGTAAIARLFAQITSNSNILANQQLVVRILDLFDDIAEQLNEQAVNERNAEEIRIDVYNAQVSTLRANQAELQAQIDNTNYELQSLDNAINYAQNKLEENQRTAEDKTSQYEDVQAECQDENANYESSSESRTEELEVIDEVRDIVTSKLEGLLNYVGDRVAAELD
jgi:chromosome segregation ATPase